MQLNDVIEKAGSNQVLEPNDIESAARRLGMPVSDLLDAFARTVATRYLRHEYSFGFADMAMNQLFCFAELETGGLSAFGRQVFGAFDEGEYLHGSRAPEEQGEALTRKLLGEIASLSNDGGNG